MPSTTDPREALAAAFYKSQAYRDLSAALTADLYGAGFNTAERERGRLDIQRKIAETRWSFCNRNNSGRFRIGLRCDKGSVRPLDDLPSFDAPRFKTRREANDWIASQTPKMAEMLAAWDAGEPETVREAA
jgi:hypothetical protein